MLTFFFKHVISMVEFGIIHPSSHCGVLGRIAVLHALRFLLYLYM